MVTWRVDTREGDGNRAGETGIKGCVSKDDDRELAVMESKSWEPREDISHPLVVGASGDRGREGVANRVKEQGVGKFATR